jgi:AFG3 family protein
MKPSPDNEGPEKNRINWIAWGYGLFLVFALIFVLTMRYTGTRETTWNDFENLMLKKNAVDKVVVVNNQVAEVYIRHELKDAPEFSEVMTPAFGKGVAAGPHYEFNIGSVETFEKKLEAAQKDVAEADRLSVVFETRTNWLVDILPWLIPIVLVIFLLRLSSAGSQSRSALNFGRSTAKLLEKDTRSTATFADVAGLEEAKQEVKEVVDFLKDPGRFTKLGAKIPKGIIIVGPPGTGKTLLAKAVAGEAQVPFFSLSGSEFVEMFVGVGASRVRDLFRNAKEKAPCIVFIDEIDAVGRSRGRNSLYSGANDERESTLNQLLTEMDGFGTNTGVIVLAATNRADILDPALLRPGRFDRHIYLELPNLVERKEIFKVHLKPLILASGVDAEFFASQTPGFSGADIANICNEAALIAARRKKDKVEKQDFLDSLDRIVAGLEKKSKIISKQEKKTIAYHEAGHALVSWKLKHVDPLVKVSIIPRGKSLGAAWYLPEERQLKTVTELKEKMCAALAGRAAEEVILGEVSSGALDDLERVSRDAYSMIAYYGFNPRIGNVSFYDSTRQETFHKPYSEETARLIDEEVRKLVTETYDKAKRLLIEHRSSLVELAEVLLKKEIIYKEDIELVLGPRVAPTRPLLEEEAVHA